MGGSEPQTIGFPPSFALCILCPISAPATSLLSLPPITSMPITAKKANTKAAVKANGAAHKSRVSPHPPWVDMIKECIIAHPGDARAGVSRPMIKKFVEDKYRIALDHAAAGQLNRAITSGSEKGTFLLPKGPSGKVKLAPKARLDAAKENTKPVSKKPASTKAAATKVPATKAKVALAKPIAARKVSIARSPTKAKAATAAKTKRATAKPTIATKPARKTTTTTAKTAAAKRPSATPKKATTAKKGVAKKAVTGEAKKPARKPKSAATTKARAAAPSSKAKLATKAKPASKAKPTSRTATAKKQASSKMA
ncbi:hypothetical protein D9615_001869 [Tricholomella constricta]|uniref:Histone H1 n=1 Tax=Tricholomella constricta TaxID=117010 RepID=A0A8H5HQ32_9AGAR|nr:hypothetical protein D9615_001869 [Tricholomella constricta]